MIEGRHRMELRTWRRKGGAAVRRGCERGEVLQVQEVCDGVCVWVWCDRTSEGVTA